MSNKRLPSATLDMRDMQENVCRSNLQLVFLQNIYIFFKTSEFYSTACFVMFKLNLLPKLKKLKDLKMVQDITK